MLTNAYYHLNFGFWFLFVFIENFNLNIDVRNYIGYAIMIKRADSEYPNERKCHFFVQCKILI